MSAIDPTRALFVRRILLRCFLDISTDWVAHAMAWKDGEETMTTLELQPTPRYINNVTREHFIGAIKQNLIGIVNSKHKYKFVHSFWFSTCRRKIARGFRIWPYFFEFCTQKWSKTVIYREIWVYFDTLENGKIHHKSMFLTTFASQNAENKVRFGILK